MDERRGERRDELLEIERGFWARGLVRVAGVDEAGLGPLAGPVVAAAVVFPPGTGLEGVDDSKALDEARRERLEEAILGAAADHAVAVVGPEEVDRLDVYRAGLAAMRRALDEFTIQPIRTSIPAHKAIFEHADFLRGDVDTNFMERAFSASSFAVER